MDSDSNSASSASSRASLSPPLSPAPAFHAAGPLTLDRLVTHFANAKTALAATHYISRANELVTHSRSLIEELAVLHARNAFLARAVNDEVGVLEDVKGGIEGMGDEVGEDFRDVVEGLDAANERLQATLSVLRETMVDALLHRRARREHEGTLVDLEVEEESHKDIGHDTASAELRGSGDDSKTLYDFIDASTHEQLLSDVRTDIDTFHASNHDLTDNLQTLQTSLQTITTKLHEQSSIGPAEKRTLYDSDPPPTTRTLFAGIEEHAAAMAELLQGLVAHYDLCVTALKHTEGGGEAAKLAVQEQQQTDGSSETAGLAVEESLYLRKTADPISSTDRLDMLAVLERDASELEDVVGDIRDRNHEQEALYSALLSSAKSSRRRDAVLRTAILMLRDMRDLHLPSHTHALATFRAEWTRIRASMASKTTELDALAGSNEAFIAAYAELLKEVTRREAVRIQMAGVKEKARRELRRLEKADVGARERFVADFGGNLPRGLWVGMEPEAHG